MVRLYGSALWCSFMVQLYGASCDFFLTFVRKYRGVSWKYLNGVDLQIENETLMILCVWIRCLQAPDFLFLAVIAIIPHGRISYNHKIK